VGWWSTSDEEKEYIGDDSADVVTAMLIKLGAIQKNRQAPVTLQCLLDCLAIALKAREDSGRYNFNRLTARLSNGLEVASNSSHSERQAIIDAVKDGLAEIDIAYRDEFERSPTLREIVDSFSFVLGYQPSRFLSDLEGVEVLVIRAD
jgi:hypothetical protein